MKIGIVGLGLIGGSLALDLRSQAEEILGVSRQEMTCKIALEKGIVDRASVNLSLLKDAEIVFICTPLDKIIPTLKKLIPHLAQETVVTDVGSVKAPIVRECSQLWSNFVGGHPMAGTEEQGIEAAQKGLFQGTVYVLTPTEITSEIAVQKVEKIAISIGSFVYQCSPEIHDRAVAWISHLPVMISAGLLDACRREKEAEVLQLAQKLASSGFRDTSRVGGGNPELGIMMARYNREALLKSLVQYRQSLDNLIDLINQQNWDELEKILELNKKARDKFIN
jgi:arogenate dehydrogenase (NADP+)